MSVRNHPVEAGFSAFLVVCDTELAPYINKFYLFLALFFLIIILKGSRGDRREYQIPLNLGNILI